MNNLASRVILGGFIIFLGAALLLNQFGIAENVFRLWPLILVAVGLSMIVNNFKNVLPGLIVLSVGVIFQLEAFDVIPFSVWNLWPLFIIFAGVSILLGNYTFSNKGEKNSQGFIKSNVLFWGEDKVVKDEFEGAILNAAFGAIKLDLRKAIIKDKAQIDVNAIFGGVEILLPPNTFVENNVVGIFGGSSDETEKREKNDDSKSVVLKGSATFAGIEVK